MSNTQSAKPFVYTLKFANTEVVLTEEAFTLFGHKISHEQMRGLSSVIFQAERVLQAHGIYEAKTSGGGE